MTFKEYLTKCGITDNTWLYMHPDDRIMFIVDYMKMVDRQKKGEA